MAKDGQSEGVLNQRLFLAQRGRKPSELEVTGRLPKTTPSEIPPKSYIQSSGPQVPPLPPLPPRVSAAEAEHYYNGLPSKPRLIARTGAPWDPPSGPEAYLRCKELRIPGQHELLTQLWEDNLAIKVHDILNKNHVDWSSTDIVRIAHDDEPDGNLILWIGVWVRPPTRLSYEAGIEVARQCKRLLLDHGIADVDVELRESNIIQMPTDIIDPTAILREPFTTTLGITICAEDTPWAEGTAGFFIAVPGVDKLFLVTARHVLFPRAENKHFERTNESQPRRNVLVLSETSFQEHLFRIKRDIQDQDIVIASQESRIAGVAGQDDAESQAIREDAEHEKKKAERRAQTLTNFLQELLGQWSTNKSRTLGHVIFSPEIVVGAGQYTQDIAVIEVDASKISPADFPGNFIDLGTKYTPVELTRKMLPHPNLNARNFNKFTWPGNRLLKLSGPIPQAEMRHPPMSDPDGEACITVLKRGRTTDVTVGKATTNFVSYTRNLYLSEPDSERDGTAAAAASKALAVIPLDKECGPFAAKGDSGAVVVDGVGRIAGILTGGGGGGANDACDVAYVTPIEFIMEVVHKFEPLADAYIKNAQSA
ncbi:hypothetical protein BDZ97DRAFT_1753925 [Flammula alnicola]|nr:hypothetical protein BDZ97DRAFT_1753925 [Flammula alnicola]